MNKFEKAFVLSFLCGARTGKTEKSKNLKRSLFLFLLFSSKQLR
jgi:ABC-type uncharacterized transport system permease subunit